MESSEQTKELKILDDYMGQTFKDRINDPVFEEYIELKLHSAKLNAENTRLRLAQPPTARSTDPETSHEAAKDARFGQTMRQLNVLLTLHRAGPLTDFELAEHTGTQQNSIGKRRLECLRAGLVEAYTHPRGHKLKRPSRRGGKSMAQVWRLTEYGQGFIVKWLEKNNGV